MSVHTKGPWFASGDQIKHAGGFIAFAAIPRDINEARLADESWLDMRQRTEPDRHAVEAEKQANVHVLAASEALLDIVKRLGVYLPVELQPEVDAVLAKARGESP